MWFVEELTPTGYKPALYAERPEERRMGQTPRKFRVAPVRVPGALLRGNATIDEIKEVLTK